MVAIGNVVINGALVLAPMAGISDYAFRKVCADCGAALTVSEMVSSKALVYKDEKTKSLLKRTESEKPFSVQIFGHEPEVMAEAAKLAIQLSGADILDINMGCPVGKIVKSGDGSALMRNVDTASEIISAVVTAVDVPVTVKFRKGFDNGSVNAVEFAKMAECSGASAIAIHGRTRAQMYGGKADWDIIRDVKKSVGIPVIANGDIFKAEDAKHILDYTGCELAMIGRGSFGRPWFFRQANSAINNEQIPEDPSIVEKMNIALGQIEDLARYYGETIACLEARHHVPYYLHGIPNSGIYKQELVRVNSLKELRVIIRNIQRDLS